MWSASSPWPHASWKRMPPLPPASTMGTSPEGAGRADSLASARAAARRGDVLHRVAFEDLEAFGPRQGLEARLHPRVAVGHTHDVEARADLVVVGEQPVRVGDEQTAPTVPAAHLHLGDGASRSPGRLVGPRQQLELAGLVHRLGRRAVTPVVHRRRAERDGPHRSAPLTGHGGRGRGRPPAAPTRSGLPCGRNRSSRRRRPGSPPRGPSRGELLDLAVVEHGTGRRGVLGEHLCHVTAPDQSSGQDAFEHVRVDEGGVGHGGIVIVVPDDPPRDTHCRGAWSACWSQRPARADGRPRGHGGALPLGRRTRPCHTPPDRPVRGGDAAGPPTAISASRSRVSPPGCSSTTWRRWPSGSVVLAEATLVKVEGRRLVFTVSAARLEADGGGLVGAGRVTRVVVDRSAFLAKAGSDKP